MSFIQETSIDLVFVCVCYYSAAGWNKVKGAAFQLCLQQHPEQHPEVSLRKKGEQWSKYTYA